MFYLFVFWLLCAVLHAGLWVAEFSALFPRLAEKKYRSNLGTGLIVGLALGPLALILEFFFSGFAEHGWTLQRPSK